MNYKNANKCHKCPQSNGENGCPHWMEITMKNDQSGEMKIDKACGHVLMPKLLMMTVAAANRTTEQVSKVPGAIVESLLKVSSSRKINGS